MRKLFLLGMVLIAISGFMGCETDPDSNPDGPQTPTGWTKGLTNLTVTTGSFAGEIDYTFSATDPAADSYTIYWLEGSKNSANDIINGDAAKGGNKIVNPGTGTIADLDPGKTYSIVVAAEKSTLEPAYSAVKTAAAKTGTVIDPAVVTLKIPDLPESATIIGASLLNGSVPVAAGMNNGGVFELYVYTGNNPIPIDFTQPWTTTGDYSIALSNSMTGAGDNYMYTDGGLAPVLYTFSLGVNTITWDKFALLGGGGDDNITLTVTDIPAEITITSGLLFIDLMAASPFPVSVTANANGTFTFENIDLDEYYVVLSTEAMGQGTRYVYMSGPMPVTYDFSSGSGSIAWASFFVDPTSVGSGGEDTITLTVENIPGGIVILMAVLLEDELSADADFSIVAMNLNGTFTFENVTLGEYNILLLTGTDPTSPMYMYSQELYMGMKMPVRFDFSDENEVTLDWDDFIDPSTLGDIIGL